MSKSAVLLLSVSSRSLPVSWVINSEVIPSNGPVFVLSAMMSPAANQHVALLEVVCARMCVCQWGEGVVWQGGSLMGKAHLLSYYLVLPADMRVYMHIKSWIHRLPLIHTVSQWCNMLYILHGGLYTVCCVMVWWCHLRYSILCTVFYKAMVVLCWNR